MMMLIGIYIYRVKLVCLVQEWLLSPMFNLLSFKGVQ